MLVVETIAKIRRAHFVDGKPIKQICRELKLSRKVVRKVLRSEETAFEYKRRVQPHPKLGAWREELERLLTANAARGRRERATLLRISEDLQSLGYEGGYDAVRRYAAAWRREGGAGVSAAFVPLSFDPGEVYQFDWSHEVVLIDGVTMTVKVAHSPKRFFDDAQALGESARVMFLARDDLHVHHDARKVVHGRVLLVGRAQRRLGRRRHGRVRVGAAELLELPAGARIPLGIIDVLDRIEMARPGARAS